MTIAEKDGGRPGQAAIVVEAGREAPGILRGIGIVLDNP